VATAIITTIFQTHLDYPKANPSTPQDSLLLLSLTNAFQVGHNPQVVQKINKRLQNLVMQTETDPIDSTG